VELAAAQGKLKTQSQRKDKTMARPSKMTGWWKLLLDKNGGRIDELAAACGVTVRNLLRWYTGQIKQPDLEKRKILQTLAGPELLKHPQCPKYLRFHIVKRVLQPGERNPQQPVKPSPMQRAQMYTRTHPRFRVPSKPQPQKDEAGSLAYLLSQQ
jgi:hypothetical protein